MSQESNVKQKNVCCMSHKIEEEQEVSEKIGDVTLIYPEKEQECDDCGKIDELRPYGPNYSKICYDCSLKDAVGAEVNMAFKLFGDVITREQAEQNLIRRYGTDYVKTLKERNKK